MEKRKRISKDLLKTNDRLSATYTLCFNVEILYNEDRPKILLQLKQRNPDAEDEETVKRFEEKRLRYKGFRINTGTTVSDVITHYQNEENFSIEARSNIDYMERNIEQIVKQALHYFILETLLGENMPSNYVIKNVPKHFVKNLKERFNYRAGRPPTTSRIDISTLQDDFAFEFCKVFNELKAEGNLYKKDGTLHKGRIAGRLFPDAYDNLTRKFNSKLKELGLKIKDLVEIASLPQDDTQKLSYNESNEN